MKKKLDGIHRGEVSKHPGHVFVRRGDVALTRALLKRGALRVVAKRGKRVEQIGVAALPEWIEAARAEVESTAGERAVSRERSRVARAAKEVDYRADFAVAVRRLYPAIPDADLEAVITRALEVSSGRVGRSAAAKALADEPVRLAVLAHIRHVHTDYDARLRRSGLGQRFGRASREDRQKARKGVKATIGRKAAEWSGQALPAATARAPRVPEPGRVATSGSRPTPAPPAAELAPAPPSPPSGELSPGTAPGTTDTLVPTPLATPAAATPPLAPPAPRRETRPRFAQLSLWQRPLG